MRANPNTSSKYMSACDDEAPHTLSYVTWKRTSFPVPNGSKNRRVTAAIIAQKKLRSTAGEVRITVRMRIALRLNIHLCHITCVPAEAREKILSILKLACRKCGRSPLAGSNKKPLPD